MKIDHAFIIGAGGTGTHLIPPLVRLLHYHEDGTKDVVIADGDSYEESNMTRQLFSERFMGMNKATAMGDQVDFAPLKIVDEFLDGDKFRILLNQQVEDKNKMILIIMSVDNHATRSMIIKQMDNYGWQNFLILSPGNDFSHGQVVAWGKKDGEGIFIHPFEKYEELEFPTDHIPGIGCAEEAVSTPQLITANAAAALCCLFLVSNVLDNKPIFDELHFDGYRMKIIPSETTPIIFGAVAETQEVQEPQLVEQVVE